MRVLPDPYVLAFLLAVGLVVLILYNRLLAAMGGSFACYRGQNSTMEMLGNTYVVDSVRLMALLLLPFYALAFVVTGVSVVGYAWTLAGFFGLWLLRKLICLMMGWLTSRRADFRALERIGYGVSVWMILFSLMAALVAWLIPETPRWALWGWMGLAAVVALFTYFRRGLSLFFRAGFSPLFWVLYLCGLEILPACVVVNILMHGN